MLDKCMMFAFERKSLIFIQSAICHFLKCNQEQGSKGLLGFGKKYTSTAFLVTIVFKGEEGYDQVADCLSDVEYFSPTMRSRLGN